MDTTESTLIIPKIPARKKCTKCGAEKPVERFSKDKYCSDGLKRRCKDCDGQYYKENREQVIEKQRIYARNNPDKRYENSKKWRKANPDKVRIIVKKWQKNNPEKVAALRKKWITENREKHKYQQQRRYKNHREKRLIARRLYVANNQDLIRKKHAAYRAAHREEAKARSKLWRIENPEKQREQMHVKRARKYGAPRSDLTASQWEFIKRTYDFRCAYCREKPKILTKDHIIPLSKGGSHTASNIVPACRSCNSKKHTGPPLVAVQPVLLCP